MSMIRYRIVCKNGRYKIQQKGWFWWFDCDCSYGMSGRRLPDTYASLAQAELALRNLLERERRLAAEAHPWITVKEISAKDFLEQYGTIRDAVKDD